MNLFSFGKPLSPLQRVITYRHIFEEMQTSVVSKLQRMDGYQIVTDESHRREQTLLNVLDQIGLNGSNCMFAVDGSLAFDVATQESDIDGVLFMFNEEDGFSKREELVRLLEKRGFTVNIAYLDKNNPLTNELITGCARLIKGKYLLGDFDPQRITSVLEKEQPYVRNKLIDYLSDARSHFWDESFPKYRRRIDEAGRNLKGNPEIK